jgi:hypothetical protein
MARIAEQHLLVDCCSDDENPNSHSVRRDSTVTGRAAHFARCHLRLYSTYVPVIIDSVANFHLLLALTFDLDLFSPTTSALAASTR